MKAGVLDALHPETNGLLERDRRRRVQSAHSSQSGDGQARHNLRTPAG
jgi:hypothetical protein